MRNETVSTGFGSPLDQQQKAGEPTERADVSGSDSAGLEPQSAHPNLERAHKTVSPQGEAPRGAPRSGSA